MRRARLPGRLRLEGLPATGAVCGHVLAEGLRESDRLPEPIFTPATKATRATTRTSTASSAAELVGEERFAEVERVSIELYASPPSTRASAGS